MIVTNSLTGGGAERSMNLLTNELLRRGWEVSLVPINSSNPDLIAPKSKVFLLNRKQSSGLIDTIRSIVEFNRVIFEWKPEIVILNCALPELLGSLMLTRASIIVLEHAKLPWVGREYLGRTVRRILKFRRAKWVAVSSHLRIWPSANSPELILQNSISDLQIQNIDLHTRSPLKRLVFIGRLSAEKRPDWLLEISSKSGIPAIFIGDGILRSRLEDKLINSNSQVSFQGYIQNPWKLLSQGDLLIVPSEWEGDGLVVVEALRANIPILLSDIPDFRRFLFPDHNYADSCAAFLCAIELHSGDLNSLRIPPEISSKILLERTPVRVGNDWDRFLRTFGN